MPYISENLSSAEHAPVLLLEPWPLGKWYGVIYFPNIYQARLLYWTTFTFMLSCQGKQLVHIRLVCRQTWGIGWNKEQAGLIKQPLRVCASFRRWSRPEFVTHAGNFSVEFAVAVRWTKWRLRGQAYAAFPSRQVLSVRNVTYGLTSSLWPLFKKQDPRS